MFVLTRIADEIYHTRRVWRGHERLIEQQAIFEEATDAVNRAVVAERIAFRLDSQADHLAASWLARATTFLPTPDQFRADAAAWRKRAEKLWVDSTH